MKKKVVSILTAVTLCAAMLAGCGGSDDAAATDTATTETTETTDAAAEETDAAAADAAAEETDAAASDFDTSAAISVYSREDGSGTRGAFIELMGIEQEDESGEKVDMTTQDATITNNTSVMMTGVAGDPYAIGYVSLGSMNETVKALTIDGVEASVETVKDGSYAVARPFNIATKGEPDETTQDFINYILSAEGQAIVSEEGYITIDDAAPAFEGGSVSGDIVVAGSSSVSPVMEKLAEAYMALNGDVNIEIQTTDSTSGMTSAIDGTCQIGMASRALKDEETAELTGTQIAMDGIAVIVNNENPIEGLTSEQVQSIYTGATTTWADVQ